MRTRGHTTRCSSSIEIELHGIDPLFVVPLLTALAGEIGYSAISAYKLPSVTARDDKASAVETPVQDVYRWRLYGIEENLQDAWRLIVQRFTERGGDRLALSPVSRERPKSVLAFSLGGNAKGTESRAEGWRRKATGEPILQAEIGPSRA